MRFCLSLVILVFTSDYLQAQDTLYKVDGFVLMVKIMEVNATQVKYLPYADQDGPMHVIGKGNILKIIYENGLIEDFSKSVAAMAASVPVVNPLATDFGRNFISINLFDLLGRNTLTISYEYTFKNGISSFKVPISIRLDDNQYYDERKVFGIGLDYYLYPFGQGASKLFYGPSFEFKKFDPTKYAYEINTAYAFLFQAGYLFQPLEYFNISIYAGLGYAQLLTSNSTADFSYGEVATRAGLNIGYKF